MTGEMQVPVWVKEASIEATIIRCTCDVELPCPHAGQPCPKGRVEEKGVISYYNRNPLRRLMWRLGRRG